MIQVEHVALPKKPLNNFEILDAVKKIYLKNFRGVFLRDTLPKKPNRHECGIMNLDDSSGSGTHWVAWLKRGNDKFYFDSFGLPPPNELDKYLGSDIFYPTQQIQPRQEVFCSHLCLHVLKQMQNGRGLQDIINSFW